MLARERAHRVDDAALIERVLRRDEQAWRELVRANEPTLRALIQENDELSASDVDDVIARAVATDSRRRSTAAASVCGDAAGVARCVAGDAGVAGRACVRGEARAEDDLDRRRAADRGSPDGAAASAADDEGRGGRRALGPQYEDRVRDDRARRARRPSLRAGDPRAPARSRVVRASQRRAGKDQVMPVSRRKDTGKWVYRTVVMLPNGLSERIFGTPAINTKQAAVEAERAHIERLLQPPRKEVPTFAQWFWGSASDDGRAERALLDRVGDRAQEQAGRADARRSASIRSICGPRSDTCC